MNLTQEHLAAFADFTESLMTPEEQAAHKERAEADAVQRVLDAQIFYDVFCTGRGPEMLELLKHKTIYMSTMDRSNAIVEGDIGLNPGEFMAGREMQNALIRWIERMIAVSQERASNE